MRGSVFLFKTTVLVAAVAACLALTPSPALAQDDPPQQAGRLSIVNGTVSIQPTGAQDWGQAYLNYPVGPGDRIYTDSDGRAEVQVGRTYVRIGPNSDVTFVDFTPEAITFGAAQGALHIRTRGLWEGQSLYVQTPSGSTTVNGAADFRVDVYPDEQSAIFTNYNGDVYVSGANDLGMDTAPGQALELVGTNPVYPQWLQPANQDDLDQWSERRDQQIGRSASFRYVSDEAPGAEDLDAYGQWSPGTDYGDMWFPNVPQGWAPYHNGHWINHDPWGWVWVEDEPWGYAPFHFGRWVSYRGRWGWVPGPRAERPVWSPALVAFAGGIQIGGGGVSVWFPLGPGEPYRPWYRCSPRYVDRVNITNIQESRQIHVQKTYVNIVNVTNVTNITYVNRTTAVTAMRPQDFASGRSANQVAVRVDPQQMARVQLATRPPAAPAPQASITRPVARPVPVHAARPILINAKGLAVAAQPRATSAPPPVRAAPKPPQLPNRTVIAPPPNVRMTPAARQAMQAAPHPAPPQQIPNRAGQPQQPQQPSHPGQPSQAGQPPVQGRPAGTPPPANGERPAPIPPNQPRPAPIPTPGARPPVQSEPQTPARPMDRPVPPPQSTQPVRPAERPGPPQQPSQPSRTNDRPAPPPQPGPPARTPYSQPGPSERPAPNAPQAPPPRPAPNQENRPPVARPPVQPPAQPQPRPEARPESRPAPPPARPAPPPPQPRPNVEQAPRQAPPHQQGPPPQDRNRKPDEKEKPKPQPQ